MRRPRWRLPLRPGPKPDLDAAVTHRQLRTWRRRIAVAYIGVFLSSAAALFWADHRGRVNDREIFESRIASVHATCKKFNRVQSVLSLLVRVSLDADPRKDSELSEKERDAKRVFVVGLHRLRPNDCEAQRRILERALREKQYDKSIPYSPAPGQ